MRDKLDPGEELRTFETRLEFLNGVFSAPYSKTEILASSVQFKLNKSYELYLEELNRSLDFLARQDSIKVVNQMK